METTNAAAVAVETTANVTENANQSVNAANANADYMKTCKLTSRVSRVRTITDGDDSSTIEYVVISLTDEFESASDGEIVKTHDVICNPWYLTNQLCDCSDLFAMIASCGNLGAKDFACLASSVITFTRTYHSAGDDYVRYDGSVEQYQEDGFMFEVTNVKLSALGEKLLMNRLS